MLDHEHPQPTRRHRYRYLFTQKHHGGHGEAQWLATLTEDDEFAVFDGADEMELADKAGNLYGAVPHAVNSLQPLGYYGEQIAKFWHQENRNLPWHGFPVWAITQGPGKGQDHQPPKEVFDRMVTVGLINGAMRNRLKGAKHV
jgi:hypothetical protein